MKSIGHIYMANIIREDIIKNDGYITIGKGKRTQKYLVPSDVLDALTLYAEEYRAGAIGPDFFPDIVTGQMTIHPTHSGEWLEFMMEELQRIPRNDKNKNQCQYRRALAFYLGYMMHYAGDMFTHRYVNAYAKGWFPSWGGILDDIRSNDVARMVKAFNDLLIILRHMCLESYLDNYIREQYVSTFADVHDGEELFRRELLVRIPLEYVRSCFGTKNALKRAGRLKEKIAKENGQTYEECFKYDFLEKFVNKMEKLKEQVEKDGATNYRVGNLKDREKDIDRWLMIWQHFANEMNTVGLGDATSDYKEEALKLIADAMIESEALRNIVQGIFTTTDVLDSIQIFELLKYAIKVEMKKAFYNTVEVEFKKIYQAVTGESSNARDYDEMIDEMKDLIKFAEPFLECELIMGEKDVPKKLKKEWGNIGKNRNSQEQDFVELQRAINYGKLCLMGVENLNSFIGEELFHEQEQHFGISQLRVYISTSDRTYSGTDADLFFGVLKYNQSEPSTVRIIDDPYVNDLERGSKREYIVTLSETLEIGEIEGFQFYLKGRDLWRTNGIRITDDSTGTILAELSGERTLRNKDKFVLPMQVEVDEETGEMVRTESIDKLSIEIKTANEFGAGTDGDVHFILVRNDGSEEKHLLDKSGYNDFEKGDLDTYDITLVHALKSLDELSHFRIHSSEVISKGWKIHYAKVYDSRTGTCIATKTFNKVLKNSSVDLPILRSVNQEDYKNWKIKNLLVVIHTADEFLAGTDGDVYFKVNYIDENGKVICKETLLDMSEHNDFERNNHETYSVTLPNEVVATKISNFEVYKKNGDDWKCYSIEVYERDTNTMIGHEVCNRWLKSSSDSICVPMMEAWYQ